MMRWLRRGFLPGVFALSLLSAFVIGRIASAQLSVNELSGFGAGGSNPPIYVTGAVSNSAAGTSSTKTVTLPSSIVAGNLLVCFVKDRATTANIFTWPAGWSELNDINGSSVAYRTADGSEGASISVTGTAVRSAYACVQLSNWTGTPSIANATGTSTNSDPPLINPSWNGGTMYIAFQGLQATTDCTAGPAGYSNFQSSKATNDPSASSATLSSDVGGSENPGTFTCSVSGTWATDTVAVQGQ